MVPINVPAVVAVAAVPANALLPIDQSTLESVSPENTQTTKVALVAVEFAAIAKESDIALPKLMGYAAVAKLLGPLEYKVPAGAGTEAMTPTRAEQRTAIVFFTCNSPTVNCCV